MALIDPFGGCAMPAFTVASATGSDLVLQPAWTTFDARYEMFGGCGNEVRVNGPTAPDARAAVTLQDRRQARPSIHPRLDQGLIQRLSSMSATRNASSRLCSRLSRGSQAVS